MKQKQEEQKIIKVKNYLVLTQFLDTSSVVVKG